MTLVQFTNANGIDETFEFETHAQASRFVRALRVKARIISNERLPEGRFGGYRGVELLRPCANGIRGR